MRLLDFRGLPRAYWYIWAGTLVNRTGAFMFVFLPIYLKQERGLSLTQVGMIGMLEGLGMLAAGLVGGALADRIGRRPTLAIAIVCGAAAMINMGFARTLPHLAIGALLLGFFGEMYRPATQAMVADLVPGPERARAFALNYWAVNLGFALAAIVGGLASRLGFTVLFVADAVTTLAFGSIVLLKVPETRPPDAVHAHARAPWHAPLAPLGDGVFLSFMILALFVGMLFIQSGSTLPVYMSQQGISTSAFGLVIAVNGVLIVLLQPIAATLVPRFRRARVLAASSLVVGLGFGLAALAHTPLHFALTVMVWTVGEIFLLPVQPAIVADLAPPALRGTYQGAFMMSWAGARVLAPPIGMGLLSRHGGVALWATCAIVGAAVGAGHLAIAGARRRRLEASGVLAFE